MNCSVCVENFNKSKRKKIECLYCAYTACKRCVERFLIENTVIPKCMSCKNEWNMEFVRSNLPRSFMDKEYKEHRKGALQVEAEANLGEYQELVQREIKLEELKEKEFALFLEENRIKKAIRDIQLQMHRLRYGTQTNIGAQTQRGEFFMACPKNECRGRLSTAYKCGLCAHYFCPDCHAEKGLERESNHECEKEAMDTVKELKANTRPCPKCHMGIFKVSGCDQMWCTQCHTCFSWRSGNMLNGTVHNPHFYEWQRQQNTDGQAPRAIGDIPCGGIPRLHYIQNKMRTSNINCKTNPIVLQLEKTHLLATHLQDITMPRVFNKFQRRNENHQEAGVKYLRGKIEKKEWIDLLYRCSRREEKYRRYYQVLEMLVFNLSEIFRQFVSIKEKTIQQTVDETFRLIDFANTEIRKMNKQYNSGIRELSPFMDRTRL